MTIRAIHAVCIWGLCGVTALCVAPVALAQEPAAKAPEAKAAAGKLDTKRGDAMLAEYFRQEVARLAGRPANTFQSAEAWRAGRGELRRQLAEMLGLDPMPPRTDLQATVTGKLDHADFTVEKLHFQSRPGLYVTGNVYIPKQPAPAGGKYPAILYVCGHSRVVKDGVAFGAKANYQHHGAWFAQNGYVCLTIDTLQLGEIEGTHHGTYGVKTDGKFNQMWWWNARGYTPAGVEAWNSIRALDYLTSRSDVDAQRLGVTGRSGGGAYSWWLAALDDRVQCTVPVAGIVDLESHVITGAIEGHCDCMFMVNTYRWDYSQVSGLVSPRALLISNTDKDRIFPLEGVVRIHEQTRNLYRLDQAAVDKLGLQIAEGPHKDTQELQVHAFRWMNRFLQKETEKQVLPATKHFTPEELKVFDKLPEDQINTKIHETFVARAPAPAVPADKAAWERDRDGWRKALEEKVFRGWPASEAGGPALGVTEAFRVSRDGIDFAAYDFASDGAFRLRLYLASRAGLARKDLDLVVLNVLDEPEWDRWLPMMKTGFAAELAGEGLHGEGETNPAAGYEDLKKMFTAQKWGMAWLAPRGVGPTAWDQAERKQTHHRRRFMLVGQTLDGVRTWDVRRGAQALRELADRELAKVPLWMQSHRSLAGVTLYASLFEPEIKRLDLWELAGSHQPPESEAFYSLAPDFLNVLRYLDLPQALAMATERSQVRVYVQAMGKVPASRRQQHEASKYVEDTAKALGWNEKQFQVRVLPK